jgi:hypothetical protein
MISTTPIDWMMLLLSLTSDSQETQTDTLECSEIISDPHFETKLFHVLDLLSLDVTSATLKQSHLCIALLYLFNAYALDVSFFNIVCHTRCPNYSQAPPELQEKFQHISSIFSVGDESASTSLSYVCKF